jgi:hypothetical protein
VLRPEATPDQLIASYLKQFGEVGEWAGTIRIKWILNSATSTQMDDDELILLATREKNKTL